MDIPFKIEYTSYTIHIVLDTHIIMISHLGLLNPPESVHMYSMGFQLTFASFILLVRFSGDLGSLIPRSFYDYMKNKITLQSLNSWTEEDETTYDQIKISNSDTYFKLTVLPKDSQAPTSVVSPP
jgi:hypothetical protein